MPLQSVKEAFGRLQALAKEDRDSSSSAKVLPIILAAGEYGRALAAAGQFGEVRRLAEDFVGWLLDHRDPASDYSWHDSRCPRLAGEDGDWFRIPDPALSRADIVELSYVECFRPRELPGRHPLGQYLLYLCSIAADAEDAQPLLDHLRSCFALDPPRLIDLLAQAADDLYWLARRRLEEPEPAGTAIREVPQAEDAHSEVAAAVDEPPVLQGGKQPAREWYGESSEEPPTGFYGEGSLTDTLTDLSMALYTKSSKPNIKRVQTAHKNKTVWVRKLRGQLWEMFFRSRKSLEEATERLRAWQNRAKAD